MLKILDLNSKIFPQKIIDMRFEFKFQLEIVFHMFVYLVKDRPNCGYIMFIGGNFRSIRRVT